MLKRKNCEECSASFAPARKEQRYCSKSCASVKKGKMRTGQKTGPRKGWVYSSWIDRDGYVIRYAALHPFCGGRRIIKEHVMVMEIGIGRRISSLEVVHHENGDRRDNRIENLRLMTRSEHSKLHGSNWKGRGRNALGQFA